MTELQTSILNVYKEFKRIAEENGLRYYAIGGTALGTVRHGGFIPWDDDLDVAMPFEDYVKFIELCLNGALNPPYALYRPEEELDFTRTFLKMHNQDTTFIENPGKDNKYKRYGGIYIDIMPIFGLPERKLKRWYLNNYCDLLLRLHRVLRVPFGYQTTFPGKLLWLSALPIRALFGKSWALNKWEQIFAKYPIGASDKIAFAWRFKPYIIFDADDFSDTVEMSFEDTTTRLPIGYDHYLKMDFGDYMVLPPEEQRVCHNSAFVDLNKPYTYYMEVKPQ